MTTVERKYAFTKHHEELLLAMEMQRRLRIVYRSEKEERLIEPHIYGLSTTDVKTLSAYQIYGPSVSREPAGWKTFEVEHIARLVILPEKFSPRPDYNPRDPKFKSVFGQVS